MPVIPGLMRLRQEDHKLEASLGSIANDVSVFSLLILANKCIRAELEYSYPLASNILA